MQFNTRQVVIYIGMALLFAGITGFFVGKRSSALVHEVRVEKTKKRHQVAGPPHVIDDTDPESAGVSENAQFAKIPLSLVGPKISVCDKGKNVMKLGCEWGDEEDCVWVEEHSWNDFEAKKRLSEKQKNRCWANSLEACLWVYKSEKEGSEDKVRAGNELDKQCRTKNANACRAVALNLPERSKETGFAYKEIDRQCAAGKIAMCWLNLQMSGADNDHKEVKPIVRELEKQCGAEQAEACEEIGGGINAGESELASRFFEKRCATKDGRGCRFLAQSYNQICEALEKKE